MKLTIQILLMTGLVGIASAADFAICSTGFPLIGSSGCGVAINAPPANNLTADGNWYVASSSSGTFMGKAFVTVNNSYPVGPTNPSLNPWLANNANDINGRGVGSSWLVPGIDQSSQYANNLTTYFAQQFALGSVQAAKASINGYWLADDYGGGIFLNGISVSQSSLPVFGGLGGPMVPFSITNGNASLGQATFQANNTIVFGVVNDTTNHGATDCRIAYCGTSPTGVRVLFTSGGDGVPEPSTYLLLGAGLAGLGILARRRRSA